MSDDRRLHRTTEAPSMASVLFLATLSLATMFGTLWILTAKVFDGRHLVGFLAGVLASGILVGQTINRAGRRGMARLMARWDAEEIARNTGTWTDPEGRTILIQYCPSMGHYHVTGSVAVGWDLQGEVWPNQATLVHVITEFERDGYVPANDEGTRSIRARLMVPGWDRFEYPGSGGAWS